MVYYPQVNSFKEAIKLASEDEKSFNESERNALRGAMWTLHNQDNQVMEKQKRVGGHKADIRLEVQRYTVFASKYEEGGFDVWLDSCPYNIITDYYIVGDRPVQVIWDPGKYYTVFKYDWQTGVFVSGMEYADEVFWSRDDVEEISEEDFIHEVENLRGRNEFIPQIERLCCHVPDIQKELGSLYEKARHIQEAAQSERRRLTKEEKTQLARLQGRSYALFEAVCQKEKLACREPLQVREALNRLHAINWQSAFSRRKSHVILFKEYLRRMALWAEVLGCEGKWPFFDAADMLCPQEELPAILFEKLRQKVRSSRDFDICMAYTHWESISWLKYESKEKLPAPYEPLILFYELGGVFENGPDFFIVDNEIRLPKGTKEDYIKLEPLLDLSFEYIGAIDKVD